MDIIEIILIVALVLLSFVFAIYVAANKSENEPSLSEKELIKEYRQQMEGMSKELERLKNIESQKKSSEVRTGLIAEQLAPFLNGFEGDPKNLYFLGRPIDYIEFNYDIGEINFIEIKSGSSKLNNHQRMVKYAIANNRINFKEVRINQYGVSVKKNTTNTVSN